ncbi:hypothetical protein C3L33_12560, partial [Rhododendron williamsianum]
MGARVPVVQQYNLRSAADSYIGGSSLHDLNSTVVDGCPGEMDGLGEVDRDAVTEEEEDDGLDNVEESSAVVSLLVFLSEFPLLLLDCIHEPYRNSLPLHSVGVEGDRSTLENNCSSRDPYDVLTTEANNDPDVAPIENARARFLDIIVDHFISSHIIEAPDSEGDYSLSLLKINIVNEANIRLSSVNVFRGKTIGVALEASGGLYRKVNKKFPRKGTCVFKRRELATSFETRSRFPELVIQEEKRVRFVVVNGLSIIENLLACTLKTLSGKRGLEFPMFKRLTGRHEVAVSARDYKFYNPRHKYRRAASNSLPSIPGLPTFAGTDNSSPMATGQGYRSVNEDLQLTGATKSAANSIQASARATFASYQFHPMHHNHQHPGQQNQHAAQFSHNHQCGAPSHLPGIAHVQQSATIPQQWLAYNHSQEAMWEGACIYCVLGSLVELGLVALAVTLLRRRRASSNDGDNTQIVHELPTGDCDVVCAQSSSSGDDDDTDSDADESSDRNANDSKNVSTSGEKSKEKDSSAYFLKYHGRWGDPADSDDSNEGSSEDETEAVNSEMLRENLERIVGKDDSAFSGLDLATLIRNKYGRSYDVQLIKKEFMGRNLLAMNVMWKYMEQKSFPLTEEEYLLRLDDVANTLKCWGAVSHIRNSLATSKERPRMGKAVSIFIDMDETGGRANEWIYK